MLGQTMELSRTQLPDLPLRLIGEQLNCFATLKTLAGLSHQFRKIFGPLLFSKIKITFNNSEDFLEGELNEPPWLHTATHLWVYDICAELIERDALSLSGDEESMSDHLPISDNQESTSNTLPLSDDKESMSDAPPLGHDADPLRRPTILMRILPKMINLEGFRWGSHSWTCDQKSLAVKSGPRLPFDILKMLQFYCPKLRFLSLYPEEEQAVMTKWTLSRWEQASENNINRLFPSGLCHIFDVRNFRNLQHLEVFGIYGNLKVQARSLALALAGSPGLVSLGMSLQNAAVYFDGSYTDDPEDPNLEGNKFFGRLCDNFCDELQQRPLSLKHLHLGRWLERTTSLDLQRLTYGPALRKIFASVWEYEWHDTYRPETDYTAYHYSICPNIVEIGTNRDGDSKAGFISLLDSWPKIEVDGKEVSQWEKIEGYSYNEVYRRNCAIPDGIDEIMVSP